MSTSPGTVHLKRKKKKKPLNTWEFTCWTQTCILNCWLLSWCQCICTVCTEASRWQRGFLYFPLPSSIKLLMYCQDNSSRPRTSLKLLLLFPNVPYVVTIANTVGPLLFRGKNMYRGGRSWGCWHWSNDIIYLKKTHAVHLLNAFLCQSWNSLHIICEQSPWIQDFTWT